MDEIEIISSTALLIGIWGAALVLCRSSLAYLSAWLRHSSRLVRAMWCQSLCSHRLWLRHLRLGSPTNPVPLPGSTTGRLSLSNTGITRRPLLTHTTGHCLIHTTGRCDDDQYYPPPGSPRYELPHSAPLYGPPPSAR
jgi:hypothetical protein